MSKKYFEAVGRQMCSLGFKRLPERYKQLPVWARAAIGRGYIAQMARWDRAVMRSERCSRGYP